MTVTKMCTPVPRAVFRLQLSVHLIPHRKPWIVPSLISIWKRSFLLFPCLLHFNRSIFWLSFPLSFSSAAFWNSSFGLQVTDWAPQKGLSPVTGKQMQLVLSWLPWSPICWMILANSITSLSRVPHSTRKNHSLSLQWSAGCMLSYLQNT